MTEKTHKIRVAVLYGGRSGEHEVSLVSAANVIRNLDQNVFEVIPVGIDKTGTWFLGDAVFKEALEGPAMPLRLERERGKMFFDPIAIGRASLPVSQFQSNKHAFDVVFPVIHGPLCEDGTIQGLLELTELPYVGCGVLSSAVGMDKDVSKRLIAAAGIRVAPFITIKSGQWKNHSAECIKQIEATLCYPVFVKPANTGSSVGVFKIKKSADLSAAIDAAFQYDTKVVVEQGLMMREIEVAVLESLDYGKDPIVSTPGEVKPTGSHEFYSYASKYLDENGAELIIPAVLSAEIKEKVQQTAKDIFLALECEGMARVDLFLEEGTNHIYFNEVNSLPGFTEVSMYPKLMMEAGLSYKQILTHLIQLAMDRSIRKKQLSREYVDNSSV